MTFQFSVNNNLILYEQLPCERDCKQYRMELMCVNMRSVVWLNFSSETIDIVRPMYTGIREKEIKDYVFEMCAARILP